MEENHLAFETAVKKTLEEEGILSVSRVDF